MNREFYQEIKNILESARNKVYQMANFAMVEAYWQIGKSIIEEQGGDQRAEYGTGLWQGIYSRKLKKYAPVLPDFSKWLRTA